MQITNCEMNYPLYHSNFASSSYYYAIAVVKKGHCLHERSDDYYWQSLHLRDLAFSTKVAKRTVATCFAAYVNSKKSLFEAVAIIATSHSDNVRSHPMHFHCFYNQA